MVAATCRDGSTAANDPEALRKSGAESAKADSTRGWRFDSVPDRKIKIKTGLSVLLMIDLGGRHCRQACRPPSFQSGSLQVRIY